MGMSIIQSYSSLKYEVENHWLIAIKRIYTTDYNVL